MFDLADDNLTRIKRAKSPIPDSPAPQQQAAADPLDNEQNVATWHRLQDSYTRELDRQEDNRDEQAREEDFYDNIQWDPEDAQALVDRGQKPIVFNVIATTVNWILGTEKRTRSDFHVLPRRKDGAKPAQRKSEILKYLSDCNKTPFHRSRAFADGVKVGIGWLEDCVENDGDGEPIVSRYESWRNMLWDSAATELCLKDARYIFRSKWCDLDIAKALFPKRAGVLELASRDVQPILSVDDEFGDEAMDRAEIEMEEVGSNGRQVNRHVRQRVRIIEAWFKVPMEVERLQGGPFGGEVYDASSPGHVEAVDGGEATIIKRMMMRVHCALFTTAGLLWIGPSPYRHNRYPFTPIWGNRRGRDGLPYGIIRGLKDLNEDINKRASKAQYLLAVNRVIADEGAAEDMDELFDEAHRPDAEIIKKTGKEVRIETEHQLAQGHIDLMHNSIAMVQQVGGVTDENQGRKTNATSGIAIERRQTQGAMATSHYFDNLLFSMQNQGEKQLSLVEQWMTDEKQFRITNMRGKPEYVTVNDGLPENDIIRSKADFVITEADWRATMRQAQGEQLMELMMKLAPANPQLVMVMLDLVIESTDVPNREEIVKRVREVTGMSDPDADEPTEQEIARKAATAKQNQLAMATAEANLRKLVSEAVKNEITANKLSAETAKTNIASIGGPKRGAIDIAADVKQRPDVAAIADEVLRDSGFVSRTEKETTAALADAAAVAKQQQQQQQQVQQPQQGGQPTQAQAPGIGAPPQTQPMETA